MTDLAILSKYAGYNMSAIHEFMQDDAIDGEDLMGSLNHGTVQTNVAGLLRFKCEKKLAVVTELSLDISQYDLGKYELDAKGELKPDVSAYLKRPIIPEGKNDLLKVTQMPDLAIEVLSPKQSIDYLIRKIGAFFALGIKSCWLVVPANESVTVYSAPKVFKHFGSATIDVIDDTLGISLPIKEIFDSNA